MGLDIIEFVMELEEKLNVEIREEEFAEMVTLGDMHEYLVRRLGHDDSWPCRNLLVFGRLRRALMDTCAVSRRRDVRPGRMMAHFLPEAGRPVRWRRLSDALGSPLPPLARPGRVTKPINALTGLLVVGGLLVAALQVSRGEWPLTASGLLGAACLWGWLSYHATHPRFATEVPWGCTTVGDVVRGLSGIGTRRDPVPSVDEVWRIVKEAFAQELATDVEALTKDSRFDRYIA